MLNTTQARHNIPYPPLAIGRSYLWIGRSTHGQRVWGRQFAINAMMLRIDLNHHGFHVRWVCGLSALLIARLYPPPCAQMITDLLQQLHTLEDAGMARLVALKTLAEHHHQGECVFLLLTLVQHHLAGYPLSEALACHPSYFDPMACALIAAGEEANCLSQCLTHLITLRQHQHQISREIKKLMTYPLVILLTTLLIIFAMMFTIIPSFESTLNQFNIPLNASTRGVFAVSHALHQFGGSLLIFTGLMLWLKPPLPQRNVFRHLQKSILSRLPICRDIIRKRFLSQWLFMLGTCLSNGYALTQALTQLIECAPSQTLNQSLQSLHKAVVGGTSLSQAMREAHLLTGELLALIEVGEHSQSLARHCLEVAKRLQQQLEIHLHRLTQLIEPALMLIMGGLIGGLILSLYLPIFHIGDLAEQA